MLFALDNPDRFPDPLPIVAPAIGFTGQHLLHPPPLPSRNCRREPDRYRDQRQLQIEHRRNGLPSHTLVVGGVFVAVGLVDGGQGSPVETHV